MKQEEIAPISRGNELLSVVIPAFNEQLVIRESVNRVRQILVDSGIRHEILVINDGSTDKTLEVLIQIQEDAPLRIINLSSNSGHMSAIRAGLEASLGDYVVTLDADLQDPPEAIPEMLKMIVPDSMWPGAQTAQPWITYDVVQAFRSDRRNDSFWKRKSAAIYYKVSKKITGINLIPHAADFRIMNRRVVEKLIALPEKNLVYRLLIPSLGFQIAPFPIERKKRFAGQSKYSRRKMIGLAIDSIIGFTHRPLRIFALTGIFASLLLFVGSALTFIIYLFGDTLPGWPSIVLLILSFNAFLFAGLGLVGEYVGRIYQLVQARPGATWIEI